MAGNATKDLVCGMECDPKTSDTYEYKGETYCFCSPDCREKFEQNPERYIQTKASTHRGQMGQGGGY